jgi:hypothetical protein
MNRLLEKELGGSAEQIVKDFFVQKGYDFVLSEDKYDDKKDALLTVNGEQLQKVQFVYYSNYVRHKLWRIQKSTK